MARRRAKRQARKRSKPVLLLGKRLLPNQDTALGGGLTAHLRVSTDDEWPASYLVDIDLRTRGAGDIPMSIHLGRRNSGHAAAEHAEAVLTRLASALRQAGAT